jgi:hypothetical protein
MEQWQQLGIVISNSQSNIVSGYRYRVRLIADGETYEM